VRSGKWLAMALAQGFDKVAIDGVIDGGAELFVRGGVWLARLEDGHIPHYALAMFVGAVFMLAYVVLR
jgi:NADH:ubiquinone oxidoreductase subunit 5 (subunit L)/multisubunit Na+/H+ antiporter MnhA subunit